MKPQMNADERRLERRGTGNLPVLGTSHGMVAHATKSEIYVRVSAFICGSMIL